MPTSAALNEIFRLLIASPHWRNVLLWVKVFSFIVNVFLALIIVVLLVKMSVPQHGVKKIGAFLWPWQKAPKPRFRKEFAQARNRLLLGREAEDRAAVLEASDILDRALRSLNYQGETLAEKLKEVKSWHMKNPAELQGAQAIRDRIVHEPTAPLLHPEAEAAVKLYESALKELGAIE